MTEAETVATKAICSSNRAFHTPLTRSLAPYALECPIGGTACQESSPICNRGAMKRYSVTRMSALCDFTDAWLLTCLLSVYIEPELITSSPK